MKPEILEQLLMDRSLNELEPEISQLLDAYLADHPEHQSLADSIEQTVMLGRAALKPKESVKLPVFPKEKMLSIGRHTGRTSVRQWLSIAASVMIGIGIGMSGMLLHNNKPAEYAVVPPLQTQPELGGLKSAQAFWSPRTYIPLRESLRSGQERKSNGSKYQEFIEKYRKRGHIWTEN